MYKTGRIETHLAGQFWAMGRMFDSPWFLWSCPRQTDSQEARRPPLTPPPCSTVVSDVWTEVEKLTWRLWAQALICRVIQVFLFFFSSERSCRHTERHQSHLTALVDDSFLQTLLHRDVSLTRMCFHTEQRTNEKTWLCLWRFIKWRSGVSVRVRDIYWLGLHNLFGRGGVHFKHLVSQWNFFSSGRTERSCFNVTVKFRVDWKRTAFSVVCFGKEPVCVQVYSTVLYCTCQYYCRYVTMHSTHHTIRFFLFVDPGALICVVNSKGNSFYLVKLIFPHDGF